MPWLADRSWVVGDKESDVALARAAGLGAVHVLTGHGAAEAVAVEDRWAADPRVRRAADVAAAVDLILAEPDGAP